MLLQGLFIPIPCPFYRDGSSYLRKLEHNVARYSLGPAAGLLALPPNGESGALTDAEAIAFLQTVGETAGKEKVLLAGVERSSVMAALMMIEAAATHGFDAVVLAAPPDWARLVHGRDAREARELLSFFQMVADRSPVPVVLWSDAGPPSLQLPVDLVASLAQHPNVIGLADVNLTEARVQELQARTADVRREVVVTTIFAAVTGRMLRPAAAGGVVPGFVAAAALSSGSLASSGAIAVAEPASALKTRSKVIGFQLISAARARDIVPLLNVEVAAMLPVLAGCAPQACFEAYAAWKDGDPALAAERAGRLEVAENLLLRLGPAAVKAGCDFNGYFGGTPRLPRLPLTSGDREAVEDALGLIRN